MKQQPLGEYPPLPAKSGVATCPKVTVWNIPGGPYRLVCSRSAGHDGDCYAAELTRCTDETDLIEGELTGSYVVGNTVLGVVFERTGQ